MTCNIVELNFPEPASDKEIIDLLLSCIAFARANEIKAISVAGISYRLSQDNVTEKSAFLSSLFFNKREHLEDIISHLQEVLDRYICMLEEMEV